MSDVNVNIFVQAKDSASAALSRVRGEIDHVDTSAKKAITSTGGLGTALGGVAKIAGGFVVGAALLKLPGLLSSVVGSASSLEESMSKVNVVFGENAKEVQDWSKESAKAFGQSRQSALEAAGTYGNLFQAFGIARPEATKMSTSLVELAADLASFNNTSVDEALVALRSGLSGETEPLKRYGVAISDARMKTEALSMGLIKSTKEALSPHAKAMASYALIMKDTALAQGDFERTSGGLANQQRILSAQLSNLKTTIGSAVLPVVLELVKALNTYLIPGIGMLGQVVGSIVPTISGLFGGLFDIAKRLSDLFALGMSGGTIGGEFSILQQAAFALGGAVTNNLVPAFQDAKEAFRIFIAVLKGGEMGGEFSSLQQTAISLGEKIREMWQNDIKPALSELAAFVGTIVAVIRAHWDEIKVVTQFLFEYFKTRIEGMIQVGLDLVEMIANIVQLIGALVRGDWSRAWDEFKQIVDNAIGIALGVIKAQLGNIPEIILGLVVDVANAMYKLLGSIVQAAIDYEKFWIGIGEDIVYGVWDGIIGLKNWFTTQIQNFFGGIVGGVKSVLGINSPSKVFAEIGQNIVQGLNSGIGTDRTGLLTSGSLSSASSGIAVNFNGPVAISARDAEDARRGADNIGFGILVATRSRGVA